MADRYDPAAFEAKWPAAWQEADLFKTTEDPKKPKFYGMDFFPYPSGAGLSVGHCRNYIPTDVVCRMKRMQGYNVLHPMGFDAFGLPAENEAIKNKTHPAPMIERYAATYRRQMELIGISYDWSRSFASSEPTYYRWTQWIFEVLHRRGLAHRKPATVNWDPVDKTVLADEEVIAGRAERSGALVERRTIPQWFFKITDYAQRLIDDLDTVDWPEGIKAQQRNWIGRSEGVQFSAKVAPLGSGETPASGEFQVLPKERELAFEVFTTRIDTIFGVTFL
ncbi:MAG: class I tRNA ligase family protein, partial [Fimbriimonas ginsengisoli]|nr:class I tRNA ligase family protein [Fimbriimonas ginsengisoli]